ncbi:hypothetical protein CARUB_v10012314mg [Capsella rubella]|uniref:Neprosin PEP catalytic domain-containing protein n=1 Tax=Capsella rubella TaxID=81985 RepID=R0GU21_9BRAS|nr:hypothetical protein CARUB_v10012314mg [Capsella rubella]
MVNFVLIILIIATTTVIGNEIYDTHAAKVDRLLKKLNKPALKSIKSPDGDIIDCVHMKNHPIYDHPLLRNHTIQMRPSSYPEGWNTEPSHTKKENIATQLWTINGKCPKNSIPIRRTRREDILRAKSIESYGKKYPNNFRMHNRTNSTSNDEIHELKATINEFSLAQIWLMAGPNQELNSIEFGWQVYQARYGDYNPRYFTFWTANGYRTGCYNLECGFVQIDQGFALGAAVTPVSTLNGEQYHIPATIWKDSRTGNWWLKLNYHILVGYWPSTLFNHLQNGANRVEWGGEILDFKVGARHTSTWMGSGNFAQEGYTKASYFRNLKIYNEYNIWKKIPRGDTFATKETCYNIRSSYDTVWGNYFYYGGPGRNQNCM